MSEVKWIKITTNIFDDEKIQLIESMPESDTIIVIWFKLLALAGKSNNGGLVMISDKVPYTKEMLTTLFRRKQTVVELALHTFEQFGMIEILDNDTILISNWEKHQNEDKLKEIREKQRIRQQEYRERKKVTLLSHNALHNGNALESSISNSNSISNSSNKKFIKPNIEDIKDYCKEKELNVDAEAFIDFYESKGWKVGKNPMKDWKAAVRNWNRNNRKYASSSKQKTAIQNHDKAKEIEEYLFGGE